MLDSEFCPTCGQASAIRQKLLLIDETWVHGPGKDSRAARFVNLRVEHVLGDHVREQPLEQFVEGFYCDRCDKGFVSEEILRSNLRRSRMDAIPYVARCSETMR